MDDLDRILAADDSIVPGSGFTGAVMDAVAAVAEEPPPLPFPWVRFAIGLVACVVWASAAIWVVNLAGGHTLVAPLAGMSEPLTYVTGTVVACFVLLAVLRIRRVDVLD